MLEAKNISKSYTLPGQRSIEILRGLNLSLAEGEMVSVIGASGSGKTTLLNMLGTLDTPDGGDILFDGELLFTNKKYTLSQKTLAKFRNRKIGFVFQFHHLLSDFTAIENVAMPEFIATGKLEPAKKHAGELLAELGLQERFEHLPSELSGGEQQMLSIGRALMTHPELIVLDEATEGLAPLIVAEIWRVIGEIRASGIATLIVDRDYRKVLERADTALVLQKGQVVMHGSGDALLHDPALATYLGV